MKKNDLVLIMKGKDKGKQGRVMSVSDMLIKVTGLNLSKKHTRANPNKKITAGIYDKEMPIHISNLKKQND